MTKFLVLRDSNVLTKNYKWVKKEITILGVVFNRFVRIKIPYWIQPSKLSDETIQAIEDFYKRINKE